MGINVYDVRAGIDSLKGEGITRAILWPGAGVGGHCLTKDTYHLERGVKLGSEELDYPDNADSIYVLARKVNDFMPSHMFKLTKNALTEAGKELKGSKIAILGWAFINDSDDARNPPSEAYYDLLIQAGAQVMVHDPHVLEYPNIDIKKDLESVLQNADLIAIMTGHSEYFKLKPLDVKKTMDKDKPAVVDGRNVIDPAVFVDVGFVYRGIGRGDVN
jgi:UDP-N-acetyl-D-mannosaminuronic acid dehydrogenase